MKAIVFTKYGTPFTLFGEGLLQGKVVITVE
jgi:hypothetical protein